MIVFVHGVPETGALWDKVRSHIDAESVALSLPGFGCPRPEGFGATKDDYVEWLVGELDRFDEPVDLVGHDWGASLTYRVVTAFGDRVRSWVADNLNGVLPDYQWHDFAKIWQTPDEGEKFWTDQIALSTEERATIFEAFGVAHEDAVALALPVDETMAACILDLYRSAVPNTYADWSDSLHPAAAPGLVIVPAEDPFGDPAASPRAAEILGARIRPFDGVGHWWALQKPAEAAAIVEDFISSVG
ncbi:MAG: alpha/beta hydrolase [Acidimicrobiales bacterium]|nr:alpha/beta hydrolase [Acidimicrobiales bacterium]